MSFDNYSIRPITLEDKELLLHWRNSENVSKFMYSDNIITPEEHGKWFESASMMINLHRFLIFTFKEQPIGFISFSKVDTNKNSCSWAFYLGERSPTILAGPAMEFLALDYVFERIGISHLTCEVFQFNSSVIKLHRKFGFLQTLIKEKYKEKHGKLEDVVFLTLSSEQWRRERSDIIKKMGRRDSKIC